MYIEIWTIASPEEWEIHGLMLYKFISFIKLKFFINFYLHGELSVLGNFTSIIHVLNKDFSKIAI
jgi:hypothetical protein